MVSHVDASRCLEFVAGHVGSIFHRITVNDVSSRWNAAGRRWKRRKVGRRHARSRWLRAREERSLREKWRTRGSPLALALALAFRLRSLLLNRPRVTLAPCYANDLRRLVKLEIRSLELDGNARRIHVWIVWLL